MRRIHWLTDFVDVAYYAIRNRNGHRVPDIAKEPDRHIERTRAERRPGEGVARCSGCDQVHLAQPAKPVHRCEATAVHPCGGGTARSDSRRAREDVERARD